MNKIAICVLGLMAVASSAEAGVTVYGKPVIDRATGNAAGNLIINKTAEITSPGQVIALRAWAENLGTSTSPNYQTSYAVIYEPDGSAYKVTGLFSMLFENTTQAFTFINPAPVSGSNLVSAGSFIGLWQPSGGAGISVDNSGIAPNPPASDSWGGAGIQTPTVGTSYNFNTFVSARDYSFQVTVAAVPAPPTLWLMGSVLAGWAASRRKRVADTTA